jgi:hypothetical protein
MPAIISVSLWPWRTIPLLCFEARSRICLVVGQCSRHGGRTTSAPTHGIHRPFATPPRNAPIITLLSINFCYFFCYISVLTILHLFFAAGTPIRPIVDRQLRPAGRTTSTSTHGIHRSFAPLPRNAPMPAAHPPTPITHPSQLHPIQEKGQA